ncbi:MAG: hypothetical protein HOK04_05745 [Verrucomicrobia bacterium]|jgi:hypothetical protein|nr:hypothetical protein [Verrucomicrobiota bacterium]
MHGARNLYEEGLQFFLFQELEKLEAENEWLMSTMPQPPDTGHVCSVTGVHFPPGSLIEWDVLDDTPPVIADQGFEEKLLEFRRQSALSFQDEIQF